MYFTADAISSESDRMRQFAELSLSSESCSSGSLVDTLCALWFIRTTHLEGRYRHPPFTDEES